MCYVANPWRAPMEVIRAPTASRNDCHGKGYAINFHGAIAPFGKLDVAVDCCKELITRPDGGTRGQR